MAPQPSTRLSRFLPRSLRRHRVIDALVRLLPSEQIQRFPCGDSEIVADLRFPEPRQAFIRKQFEDYGYCRFADSLLPADGVHFDIGANFGFHTFGLCRIEEASRRTYHLFEPNSYCVRCLELSAALFPGERFVINHAAIGCERGKVTLRFEPSHLGGGFIEETPNAGGTPGSQFEKVEQWAFDDYIDLKQIKHIDLAKVDIEGCEVEFLRGGLQSLSNGVVDSLYMEVSEENLARRALKPTTIYETLRNLGFHLLFPHRRPGAEWAVFQGGNGQLELSDFSEALVEGQFDIFAIHDRSRLWATRRCR